MKIVFTGGGTGGHFYPIIAVAEKVNEEIAKQNIIGAELYYFSDDPYDKKLLFENGIKFQKIPAGKMRIYFSIKNFFDLFKVAIGVLYAIAKLFSVYPDVVFGKGGYASFPTLFAARILRIPVIIHESDVAPGRVNAWASKFAARIATSFKDSAEVFPPKKTAWLGQPIRGEISVLPDKEKGRDYFKLESELPTILVLGGSQGAELINNAILESLELLLPKYQIIHQSGLKNEKVVSGRAEVILGTDKIKTRYVVQGYLSALEMKMAAASADLVISRAGSTLFEISSWGIPSILVPFNKSNADHSKKNAFAYARAGGCIVIEEGNLTPHVLSSEVDRVMSDKNLYKGLQNGAKAFLKPGASEKIAQEIIKIALSHEKK